MKHTSLNGRVFQSVLHESVYHTFGSVAFTELHPDTDPDVIAARHREEVSDAYYIRGLETPEEIGEALTLPVWNVRRHLEALGVEAAEAEEPTAELAGPARRGSVGESVHAVVAAAKGPITAKEIAGLTGAIVQSVYYVLKSRPEVYEAKLVGRCRGHDVFGWKLKAK